MIKITYLTLIIAFSLWVTGCGNSNGETKKEQLASVYTFRPEGKTNISSTSHTSTVEEGKSVSIGFKTGGEIKRLTVGEGNYVKKGQVIGYLDDIDYKLTLQQLETQYAQVSSEIKRIEEMYRHKSISENDYEKAKAGLEQLKIQLDLTKNQLAYTRLTAPISGHVVERFMEEGEMVGAGTPVFKIVDDSGVEAVVALSANAYAQKDHIIKCQGKSSILGNKEIPLDIISFIPDADNNSLFRLRLRVPDSYRKQILPGMNLNVEIVYDSEAKEQVHKIPSRALFERDGKSYVWTVNPADSILTAHSVDIIGAPEGKYSFVAGLNDDDEIVAVGVHHLSDKQKVKVIGNVDNLKGKAVL
ncbi:MAG: efflux RND transporter periplasmic adaptor subunit [Muribaculaceae bacterium]|nr:efflux RND transporter periplasmic adaptor subunit [Muribaculaceae bacterium]